MGVEAVKTHDSTTYQHTITLHYVTLHYVTYITFILMYTYKIYIYIIDISRLNPRYGRYGLRCISINPHSSTMFNPLMHPGRHGWFSEDVPTIRGKALASFLVIVKLLSLSWWYFYQPWYMYVHIVCVWHTGICIYIYTEREREQDVFMQKYFCMCPNLSNFPITVKCSF